MLYNYITIYGAKNMILYTSCLVKNTQKCMYLRQIWLEIWTCLLKLIYVCFNFFRETLACCQSSKVNTRYVLTAILPIHLVWCSNIFRYIARTISEFHLQSTRFAVVSKFTLYIVYWTQCWPTSPVTCIWQESIFSWRHQSNGSVYSAHFLMSLLRSERTRVAWVRRCANSSCELKKRRSNYCEGRANTADVPIQGDTRGAGTGSTENDDIMASIPVWICCRRSSVPSLHAFIQFLCTQHLKTASFFPCPKNKR
jgi:hypothetical protein